MNHHPRMNNSSHQIAQDVPINPGFGGPITVGIGPPTSAKDSPFYNTCKFVIGSEIAGDITAVYDNMRLCRNGQCPKSVYDKDTNRAHWVIEDPSDPCYQHANLNLNYKILNAWGRDITNRGDHI
jgi:hypothetical protein